MGFLLIILRIIRLLDGCSSSNEKHYCIPFIIHFKGLKDGIFMGYHEDIEDSFNRTYKRERDKYIKKWMVSWNYQSKRGNKSIHSYNGPEDLIKWFEWQTKSEKTDYFDDDKITPLINISKKADFRILEEFHLEFDEEKYEKYIGRYNAQDYLYQNFYPDTRKI